ncbi:hypothetical protein WICPIJ_005912 [Wickerhamomyces pijperi]|uniref:MRH domain-containing protein n=1 Tax=Wickerhamomyces pijperi TaxID=599730 RepID=A0A9P8Q5F2_WICPI|nr:hypothetical protein WICPIJ_005912 [Wickerhamomyces pijperi]
MILLNCGGGGGGGLLVVALYSDKRQDIELSRFTEQNSGSRRSFNLQVSDHYQTQITYEKASHLMKIQYCQLLILTSTWANTVLGTEAKPFVSLFGKRSPVAYATSDESITQLQNKKQVSPGILNDDPHNKGDDPPNVPFCSATNPLTNGFYDLTDLSSLHKDAIVSWNAKGHDYDANFTLGICSSPVKPSVEINPNYKSGQKQPVLKIENDDVGAIYTDVHGDKFSIGNFNPVPVFRGKKLTLTYENGSYCPNGIDRKSALLQFTCDKEISQPAQVSFIGALHDCDYFFEVRTIHACPKAHKQESISVIWIFLFIVLAAVLVYTSAGFLYKRIILNRRGWSQLPTYNPSKATNASPAWLAGTRSSRSGSIRLDSVNDRFGFVEDQNNLLDSLDENITEQV